MATPPLVHIGYHKTGTSYLQKKLFTDEAHFTIPWGAQSTMAVEHFLLAHPMRFDPEAVRGEFYAAIAEGDTRIPVISQEALSGRPVRGVYYADQVARRIRAAFPDARILIGIRQQEAMLESLYFQYIRMGGTDRLETLLGANTDRAGYRPTFRLDHLEYDLMIEHYAGLFGAQNVLALPLELLAADPAEYVARINGFLGLDWAPEMSRQAVNARRSDRVMQLERRLNMILPPPANRPKTYAETPLIYRMRNRVLRLLDRADRGRTGSTTDAMSQLIDTHLGEYFCASNRRCADRTGLDLQALGYKL